MIPQSARLRAALLAISAFVAMGPAAGASGAGKVPGGVVDTGLGPVPAPRSGATDRRLQAIRARYHRESLARVVSIRFTAREGHRRSETVRHWTWFPKTDSVFFRGEDAKGLVLQAGYSRRNEWSLSSGTIARIDSAFSRDQFALLFPHLFEPVPGMEMKLGATSGKSGEAAGKPGDWIRIAYPGGEGIRAGETYEVLADSDGTIRAWKVPVGAVGKDGLRFEWSPPVEADGLTLSLERTGPDGRTLRFTDVKVSRPGP